MSSGCTALPESRYCSSSPFLWCLPRSFCTSSAADLAAFSRKTSFFDFSGMLQVIISKGGAIFFPDGELIMSSDCFRLLISS